MASDTPSCGRPPFLYFTRHVDEIAREDASSLLFEEETERILGTPLSFLLADMARQPGYEIPPLLGCVRSKVLILIKQFPYARYSFSSPAFA